MVVFRGTVKTKNKMGMEWTERDNMHSGVAWLHAKARINGYDGPCMEGDRRRSGKGGEQLEKKFQGRHAVRCEL